MCLLGKPATDPVGIITWRAAGSVNLATHPFPYHTAGGYNSALLNLVMVLGIGIGVVPGGFAIDVVRDRASRMKHQLNIAGVSWTVYWLAYFMLLALTMGVLIIYIVILALAVNISGLVGPALPTTILLLLLYIPYVSTFTFIASHLFATAEKVQSIWPVANTFLTFLPYILVSMLDMFGYMTPSKILHYICTVLFPPYVFTSISLPSSSVVDFDISTCILLVAAAHVSSWRRFCVSCVFLLSSPRCVSRHTFCRAFTSDFFRPASSSR